MPHFIFGAVGTTLPRSLGSSGPMKPQERGVSVHRDDVSRRDFLFSFWADILFAFGLVRQVRLQKATSHTR